LAFHALLALQHLGLLRRECGQLVLFALRPVLVQRGNDTRGAQQL